MLKQCDSINDYFYGFFSNKALIPVLLWFVSEWNSLDRNLGFIFSNKSAPVLFIYLQDGLFFKWKVCMHSQCDKKIHSVSVVNFQPVSFVR